MGILEDRDLSGLPSISEFYKGKTIFITGGSGFMGQVLVEKLLYSCSDLEKIYLLIRPKRGVNVEQRLTDMYKSPLFERLKAERPGLYDTKVKAIIGDIDEIDLGVSKEDQEYLKNSVHIVFHCAASVRFNETLVDATNRNLRCTRDLVKLATGMKKLLVFVHVSTCYANTNFGQYLEERMYPPHSSWQDTLEICQNLDEDTINKFTPKLLGNLPNTYVFTKQLAEHLVYEQQGILPVVITRPSVVISIYDEPVPGWINNYNGPIGLCIGIGKGVIRDVLGHADLVTDYIPVDYCIKHFIAAAWIRGTKPLEPTDPVPIYACSSYNQYQISLGELCTIGTDQVDEYPLEDALRAPQVSLTMSPTLHYIKFILYQLIPSIIVDILLWLFGKKTILVKVQRRIYHVDLALEHYLSNYWHFDNRNFLRLRSCIKDQDKKQFDYDLKSIDKEMYIRNGVLGGKVYLLNEKLENYKQTRQRLFWIKLFYASIKMVLIGFLTWFLMTMYLKNTVDNYLRIKPF